MGHYEWNSREFFEFASPDEVAARIESGADPNDIDRDGRTPLHHAAVHGRQLVVIMLLAAGAKQLEDAFGWTPLHCAAAAEGRPGAIVPLLDPAAGAAVGGRTDRGITPLHFAAMHGTAESVRLLLQAGACPCAIDDAERTPFHCAVVGGHDFAASLLWDAEACLGDEEEEEEWAQ